MRPHAIVLVILLSACGDATTYETPQFGWGPAGTALFNPQIVGVWLGCEEADSTGERCKRFDGEGIIFHADGTFVGLGFHPQSGNLCQHSNGGSYQWDGVVLFINNNGAPEPYRLTVDGHWARILFGTSTLLFYRMAMPGEMELPPCGNPIALP